LSCWIRIHRQGKTYPQKYRKKKELSCFEVLDVLFFRLKASPAAWASGRPKLQILMKKYIKNFQL
jgi:hypothetical protein